MRPAELVQQFYSDVWNRADEMRARNILSADFRFRGSLGAEKRGPDGFIDYMRSVHAALAGYTCTVEDLIETDNRAAARVSFTGVHRGEFFGVPATGRQITWSGAAIFTCAPTKITAVWVLGDIDSIKQQLGAYPSRSF